MKLVHIIEQDYQMTPQQQERWGKIIDMPQAPDQQQQNPQQQYTQQQQQQQKKRSTGKEYRMKFKDEFGGGEYKIKVRQTPENEIKYNYGHYNMPEKPDLSQVDQSRLTPKGMKVYQQIDAVLKNNTQQPEQTPVSAPQPQGTEHEGQTTDRPG